MSVDKESSPTSPSLENKPRNSSNCSEWEVISEPPSPLEEHKHLIPPVNEQPRTLCGYLRKETTNSLIKQWRQRWVEFDDDRCCLLYYNAKNDNVPQGCIDVSNAAFSYSVENMYKHQFEIKTPGCSYYFQANTQEAMFKWIDALQKKRRKFVKRSKTSHGVQSPDNTSDLVGLVGEGSKVELNGEEQELEENGVVVDSHHPAQSPLVENHIQKLLKRIPKPPFLPNSLSTSEGDRRSNFYTNVDDGRDEQRASPHTEVLPEDQGSPTSGQWRPKRQTVRELLRKVSQRNVDQPDVSLSRQQKLEDAVELLKQELSYREQAVKDRDELIDFLRSEVRLSRLEEVVRKELTDESSKTNDAKVDVLTQRDQLISSLQKSLEQFRAENDSLETELRSLRQRCSSLSDEVALYRETIVAKDHVVVELTNKLFSMEKGGQLPMNPHEAMMPTTTKMLEMEIAKMKEVTEAYKNQNTFLNCELVELNELRTADAEAMKRQKAKQDELEAEYIRLQSKHVVLLKETQNPKINYDTELVSQMMEEAIKPDHPTRHRTSSDVLYDPYGFKHDADVLTSQPEETLDSVVRRLDQQAQQKDENYASHVVKWDNYMIQFGSGRDMIRSDELKIMVRNGVPRKYRGRVWKWCVRDQIKNSLIPGCYQQLLSENAGKTSVALNQIELDLLRTLPQNKYYNSPDAPGIAKLRRILVAFSWYNTHVGYCQGLNRLAAIALLFLDEEDAFRCLVAVVDHILPPDYYNKTLLGSQSDQKVLREMIADKMHQLSEHLNTCDINFSLITFNWFHTIFIDDLPIETMLRIWDTFLYEGSKVLFRYAIAIFKYNEESLLAQANSITIFNRLRAIAQEATDVNKLTQIAFYDPVLRSFPRRRINQRRTYFRTVIQEELDEVDRQRDKIVKSGIVRYPDEAESDGED